MAKKAVATLQKGEGRGYTKVIKMVRSEKTGAYIFQEAMVLNADVKDYFAKQYLHFLEEKKAISQSEIAFFMSIKICRATY